MSNITPPIADALRALGLSQHASEKEVIQKYKQLAITTHPDKNTSPHAKAEFQSLQNIYETLKSFFQNQGAIRSPIISDTSVNIVAEGFKRAFRRDVATTHSTRQTQEPLLNVRTKQLRHEQLLLRGKKFCTRIQQVAFRSRLDKEISELKKIFDLRMKPLQEQEILLAENRSRSTRNFQSNLSQLHEIQSNLIISYKQCRSEIHSSKADHWDKLNAFNDVKRQYEEKNNQLSIELKRINDKYKEWEKPIIEHEEVIAHAKQGLSNELERIRNIYISAYHEGVRNLEQNLEQEQDELCGLLSTTEKNSFDRQRELLSKHSEWMEQYYAEIREEQKKFIEDSLTQMKNLSLEADIA